MNRNVLALAYLGDAVYEIFIREYLMHKNIEKVNELQKEAIKYVSAKGQEKYLLDMIKNNFLEEEELAIVRRGKNNKKLNHPKNTDIITYKNATGLETLIGALYLENKMERVSEIMDYILKEN